MLLAKLRDGAGAATARTALEMATLGGAACLGRTGELGVLAPGAVGDVAVWSLDGPRFAGAVSDPIEAWLRCGPASARDTIVHGRAVVEDGALVHPDLDERLRAHRSWPAERHADWSAMTPPVVHAALARRGAACSSGGAAPPTVIPRSPRRRRAQPWPARRPRTCQPSRSARWRWSVTRSPSARWRRWKETFGAPRPRPGRDRRRGRPAHGARRDDGLGPDRGVRDRRRRSTRPVGHRPRHQRRRQLRAGGVPPGDHRAARRRAAGCPARVGRHVPRRAPGGVGDCSTWSCALRSPNAARRRWSTGPRSPPRRASSRDGVHPSGYGIDQFALRVTGAVAYLEGLAASANRSAAPARLAEAVTDRSHGLDQAGVLLAELRPQPPHVHVDGPRGPP